MNFDFSYLFTKNYWIVVKDNILRWKFLGVFLSLYGLFWGIMEPIVFFVEEDAQKQIRQYWWAYLILTLSFAVFKSFPKFRYKFLISGKDSVLELAIGDFFSRKGDMIISTNSHFVTTIENHVIAANSIQGQFTNKYYTNVTHLDNDLDKALENQPELPNSQSRYGKNKEYELGTIARISVKKKRNTRNVYFVAISKMDENSHCSCSKDEFIQALGVMWNNLQVRGFRGDIIMPIIGSGFARVDSSREDLIRMIAKSFVAATTNQKVCDKLSIVVYSRDINRFDMNLERVRNYLHYEINY